MLVDQHYARGVEVSFFGGRCLANPLIAQLAAAWCVPAVDAVFGAAHRLDRLCDLHPKAVAVGVATMRAITSVIEGWVREHDFGGPTLFVGHPIDRSPGTVAPDEPVIDLRQ